MKKYHRPFRFLGHYNLLISLSYTKVAQIYSGDTLSHIGIQAGNMHCFNAFYAAAKFILTFRAATMHRITLKNVHAGYFYSSSLPNPFHLIKEPLDKILLSPQSSRMKDPYNAFCKKQLGAKISGAAIEKDRAEPAPFKNFFLYYR